jgi:hypothetical protein
MKATNTIKPSTRTPIRGKGWKKVSTIDSTKFELIAGAILVTLTSEPITFTEVVKRVEAHVKPFDGSVGWFTISCLRELEVRGQVCKQQKPVRYSKA